MTQDRTADGWVGDRSASAVLSGFTGAPLIEGNTVRLLHDEDILPAMLAAIQRAEDTIDLMTYIWRPGGVATQFVDALVDRARAGVRVRALLDGVGCRHLEDRHREAMRAAGVQLEFFRPHWSWKFWQLNMRNHRRVLVVDDRVAFTGGAGIGDEWTDRGPGRVWRETHLEIRGPAIDAIHGGFYSDWVETPNPPVDHRDRFPQRQPEGDTPVQVLLAASQPGWNVTALALRAMIGCARERLRITSGYFRPPRHFRRLLCQVAAAGVAVDVLVPGKNADRPIAQEAGRHHYAELLEGGVGIWEYDPAMLHAKIVTIDQEVALVGTPNFDARSLSLNEQIAVLIHDRALTTQLDDRFDEDCRHSTRIVAEEWRGRRRLDRLRQWAAHASTFPVRGAGATKRGQLLDGGPWRS